jgi:16S rRNA (cytidine1402-2'-O)-methyltransferase
LPASLRSLSQADPERPVAVCRELTKRFEEVVRGSAKEIAPSFDQPPKGEITLVLGPANGPAGVEGADALAAVAELVGAGISRRRAAELVSRLTGVPRNRLYRDSL